MVLKSNEINFYFHRFFAKLSLQTFTFVHRLFADGCERHESVFTSLSDLAVLMHVRLCKFRSAVISLALYC